MDRPGVRSQNGGQDTYLGIYFWNNGDPQLRLYKRTAAAFTQLGRSYDERPVAGGYPAHAERGRLGDLVPGERDERIAVTDST